MHYLSYIHSHSTDTGAIYTLHIDFIPHGAIIISDNFVWGLIWAFFLVGNFYFWINAVITEDYFRKWSELVCRYSDQPSWFAQTPCYLEYLTPYAVLAYQVDMIEALKKKDNSENKNTFFIIWPHFLALFSFSRLW